MGGADVRRRSSGPVVALSMALLVLSTVAATRDRSRPEPPLPSRASDVPQLFETSAACLACHNNLTTASGEDVSIGTAWRATMMANSSRDPYWQAAVRSEVLDHPEAREKIEGECATCHMPMLRVQSRLEGRSTELLARLQIGSSTDSDDLLAADGVSCTVCHQIGPEALGTPASFNGHFSIDSTTPFGERPIYGPHEVDRGRTRIMHSSSGFRPVRGSHLSSSEVCATCHTLYTDALDATGGVVGRFPEQVPFLEWKHSLYADGREARSCQACHMPVVAESIAISGVWGQKRGGLARHEFLGGNFFVLRMLSKYRNELGVQALPQELDASARRTIEHLQTDAARLRLEKARVDGARLTVDVAVQNLAGHKLPTAYPSRRVWLHVTVRNRTGELVFESGRVDASGAIAGNDNDADASAFESHHEEITRPDEVQIYESILADPAGRVTTGLLSAVRYVKDNRVLPDGFDKRTASPDIAVQGHAADDENFIGGSDRVRYTVSIAGHEGPFRVEATLRYQPIAFRWARNLARHEAAEIARFVTYYDAMASASSVVLARDSVRTP